MAGKPDLVELGLHCASISMTLDEGTHRKELDDLSESLCDATDRFAM